MKSSAVSLSLLLLVAAAAGAGEAASEVVVCTAGSYVAVASWSAERAVEVTVAPVVRPLGEPRTLDLPVGLTAPVDLRCRAGFLIVSGAEASFKVSDPISRTPLFEPVASNSLESEDDESIRLACRGSELHRGALRPSLENQLPLGPGSSAGDLAGRDDPFSFAIRRASSDAEGQRWQLVVQEEQRRGVGNRMSPVPVEREATVVELLCPTASGREPGSAGEA